MQLARVDPSTYEKVQIARSIAKWDYCNVTPGDVMRYRAMLLPRGEYESVCCIGVRNGAEMEYFRAHFPEVVGVDINPDCGQPNFWAGSFDAMPEDWTGRFDLIFSNAFDHSQHPDVTAREWRRIIRPGGAALLAFVPNVAPTETEPTGDLTVDDMRRLFPGELLAEGTSEHGYCDLLIKVAP